MNLIGSGAILSRILLLLTTIWCAGNLSADSIVTSTLFKELEIDAKFQGQSVLLFGYIPKLENNQVLITLRGPVRDLNINKKYKTAGLWIGNQKRHLTNVPILYLVSASEPLSNLSDPYTIKNLTEPSIPGDEFYQALNELQQKKQLRSKEIGKVEIVNDSLFSTNLWFSSSVIAGNYTINVYHFHNKQLLAHKAIPFSVRVVGLEHYLYELNYNYPLVYCLIAVFTAIFIGLIINFITGKIKRR